MARTQSHWREEAEAIIMGVLAPMPVDATDAEKRRAVSRAYPWNQRSGHPYQMWRKVAREMLGPNPPKAPAAAKPLPLEGMPADLAGLLSALQADPGDELAQSVLCDWLEDAQDGRAKQARLCRMRTYPSPEEVAKVMHPKGRVIISGLQSLFHAMDGSGYKFTLEWIANQLAGKLLLTDPAVTAAAAVVRGRGMLKLFAEG